MDIRIAVSTAGIFFLVYSIALGVPVILYWKGYYFIALCSAIGFATPAPFIYNYFRKQAEDKILREEHNRQNMLSQASSTFADKLVVEEIVKSVVDIVGQALQPRSVVLYLFDGEKYQCKEVYGDVSGYPDELSSAHPLVMNLKFSGGRHLDDLRQMPGEEAKASGIAEGLLQSLAGIPAVAAVPFHRGESMPGFLMLGERLSRVAYSDRDLAALNGLAVSGALAIVNALNYANEKKTFEEKMHEQRLKDIGLLGSAVAHQMANRLHRITSELWIAQDLLNERSLLNDSREELVAKIRECFMNYPLIIRDALSARAIADALKRSSKKGAEPRAVPLKDLIAGGKALAEVKHPSYKGEFVEEYDERLVLWVNDTALQDVFSNAIDNSMDSLNHRRKSPGCPPDYKGRITVKAYCDGANAIIDLEDNGTGIRPENMEKLFIPLFTTKGTENGTGLGLHAMKSIVKSQGGDIVITSEFGQWTNVQLRLPLPPVTA